MGRSEIGDNSLSFLPVRTKDGCKSRITGKPGLEAADHPSSYGEGVAKLPRNFRFADIHVGQLSRENTRPDGRTGNAMIVF
jgi:hypothetical protein